MRILSKRTHKQAEIDNAQEPFVAVPGGLGAGKTHMLARSVIKSAVKTPRGRFAVASASFPQLINSTYEEIDRMLFTWGIRAEYSPYNRRMEFSNGARIHLVSFEMAPGRLKGPEYDEVYIDEFDMTDADHYYAFTDRARGQLGTCNVRVFGNAVPQSHYVSQDYWLNPKPGHRLITVSTYDNRRFLRPGTIERLEQRYKPGTRGHQKWMLGQCGVPLDGAVLPEFDAKADCLTNEKKAARWKVAAFFHDKRPTVLLVCAMFDNVLWVLDEYSGSQRPIDAHIEAMRRILPPVTVKSDMDGDLYREYRKRGFPLVPARGARVAQDLRLDSLRARIVDGGLKIAKRNGQCAAPKLLREFEEWIYNDKEEPIATNCEAMQCLMNIAYDLDPNHTALVISGYSELARAMDRPMPMSYPA